MSRWLYACVAGLGAWRALGCLWCIGIAAVWLGSGCGGRAAEAEMGSGQASPRSLSGSCEDNPLLSGCAPSRLGSGRPSTRLETCEDNPLLVGCSQPPSELEPNPQPVDVQPEPDEPDPGIDDLIAVLPKAANVLAAHCGQCHGSQLAPEDVQGGLGNINDLNLLIQRGYIVPCFAEQSPIIDVMRSGRMPPLQSGLPPVSAADIESVARAITFDCTE